MRLLRIKHKKRALVIGAASIAAMAAGGIAAAFLTASGSGPGTASSGTTVVWTVSAAATSGTIFGTGGSRVITFTVKNNTGSPGYSETYGTQSVAVTGLPASCPTGSFTVARTGTTAGTLTAAGGHLAAGASATYKAKVSFATLGTSTAQTNCQSGTVTVTLTVNS